MNKDLRLAIRALALIQLFAIALAFVGTGERSISVRRGDFPAFYTAAVIAKAGEYDTLYNVEAAKKFQSVYWPQDSQDVNPFIYPPFVAFFLSPLANFSPLTAQLIFLSLMCVALVVSATFAIKFIPSSNNLIDLLAILSLVAPITQGVFGSQTVALSLLFYSVYLSFFLKNTSYDDMFAGAALGFWLFKPHFPLIVLLFMVAAKRWYVIAGALIPALIYYLIGSITWSPTWPLIWSQTMLSVADFEFSHNSINMVSINGVLVALGKLAADGKSIAAFRMLAWLINLTLMGYVVYLVRKERLAVSDLGFLLGPLIVLVSPHTIYYDLALCVFPVAYYLVFDSVKKQVIVAATLVAMYFLVAERGSTAITPLFLAGVASFYFVLSHALVKKH